MTSLDKNTELENEQEVKEISATARTQPVYEPFVRMVAREDIPFGKALLIRLIAILASLIVSGLLIMALTKMNPFLVYAAMFEGAFGTDYLIWNTIRDAMLLLCVGIGLAPAFKMRFWNIGAEGQILVGAIASAAMMIYFKDLNQTLLLIIMGASSLLIGALWGLLPAVFKAKWGTNETLFTLMMNYIAIRFAAYFVTLWENPKNSNSVGVINLQGREGWFPEMLGQKYMLNVILVISLAVLVFFYLKKTKQGYEIAIVGESENTARYAGINVKKVIIRTMLISGAICGFAGFIAVGGVGHTISTTTAGGRGFTAIIVAWMAKFNTFVMIAVSFLIVFLDMGACEIASRFNMNEYISDMITGIILFFILGCEFFIRYRLVFRHKDKEVA